MRIWEWEWGFHGIPGRKSIRIEVFGIIPSWMNPRRERGFEGKPNSHLELEWESRLLDPPGSLWIPLDPGHGFFPAVREEIPVPPVRALLLLGPEPAPARPRQPRGHQARLSLQVPAPSRRSGAGKRGIGGVWGKKGGDEAAGGGGWDIWELGGIWGGFRGFCRCRFGVGFGDSRGRIPRKSRPVPPGCSRYCTEGKRTFSSRLILEKHIQVRHGIKVTDPAKSQEVVIARIGAGPAQVGIPWDSPAFPGISQDFPGISAVWGGTGGVSSRNSCWERPQFPRGCPTPAPSPSLYPNP